MIYSIIYKPDIIQLRSGMVQGESTIDLVVVESAEMKRVGEVHVMYGLKHLALYKRVRKCAGVLLEIEVIGDRHYRCELMLLEDEILQDVEEHENRYEVVKVVMAPGSSLGLGMRSADSWNVTTAPRTAIRYASSFGRRECSHRKIC